MFIGLTVLMLLIAAVCYLLLLGSSQGRDWEQEDQEQAEYLEEYIRRRGQRKRNKRSTDIS